MDGWMEGRMDESNDGWWMDGRWTNDYGFGYWVNLSKNPVYYHTIYLVFLYFASFTDYEDEIFEVISNLHIQESKFGRQINKFGGKSLKKSWTPQNSWSLFFSKSVYI